MRMTGEKGEMKRPGFIAKAGLSGCLAAWCVCVGRVCVLGVCVDWLCAQAVSDSSYSLNAFAHFL